MYKEMYTCFNKIHFAYLEHWRTETDNRLYRTIKGAQNMNNKIM